MTSTKTYYFTTVLRTVLTEQKASGPGDQPGFDDIASFEDFFTVREKLSSIFLFDQCSCLGYGTTYFRWFISATIVQW